MFRGKLLIVILCLILNQEQIVAFSIQKFNNLHNPSCLVKPIFLSQVAQSNDEHHSILCGDMIHWLQSNEAIVGDIEVTREGEGLGLVLSKEVSEGDILLELERENLLTYDKLDKNTKLSAAIEEIPEELWSARLGLKLLSERVKTDSNHWSYIKYLPASFAGVPLFFLPEEVQALQYPPIQEQIKKRGLFLDSFSKNTLPNYHDAFSGVDIDLNVLGWAMTAVSSRAFRIDGESKPAAMLPLADMANHDFELKNAQVMKSSTGSIVLKATSNIKQGDYIYLSYGNYTNDYFLLDYGFVVQDNPHDYVELNFDPSMFWTAQIIAGVEGESSMDEDKVLQRWQLEKLEKLGLAGKGATTNVKIFKNGVEDRFLAAARILCSEPGKDAKTANLRDLKNSHFSISKTGEKKAIGSLIGACMLALANFPTTIEQDNKLIRTPGLSHNMKLAIHFRLGKKKLLFSAIEALTKSLQKTPKKKSNKDKKKTPASNKGFAV